MICKSIKNNCDEMLVLIPSSLPSHKNFTCTDSQILPGWGRFIHKCTDTVFMCTRQSAVYWQSKGVMDWSFDSSAANFIPLIPATPVLMTKSSKEDTQTKNQLKKPILLTHTKLQRERM